MSTTTTKPKQSDALVAAMHRCRDFIATNGSANVRQILANVFHNQTPLPQAIDTCHTFLRDDGRFMIIGDGAAAVVRLIPAEPETLDVQALAAGSDTEERQEAPAATEATPVPEVVPETAAAVPEQQPQQDQTAPAEDQAAPTADQAPNIDAQPGNEIIVKSASGVILAAIADNGGEMGEGSAIASAAPGFKSEESEAAIARLFLDGLIEKEGGMDGTILVLTCAGWTEAMARAKAKADEELAKKNDELRALHKHIVTEKELAEEVKACEAEVESAKATVAARKEALATANIKLAAFVRGDVQTSFLPDDTKTAPTGEVSAYEKGMQTWDPNKADAVNPFRDDPQRSDWQRGYDAAKAQNPKKEAPQAGGAIFKDAPKAIHKTADEIGTTIDALDRAMMDENERQEIRIGTVLGVAKNTVNAYEREYLIVMGDGGGPDFQYLALPLYTKDEWQQLHEAKYGRCVEGIDQTDDAKNQRQTGGEFCGKVVKLGRKKAVIGPVDDALCITAVMDDSATAPAEDEPEDDDQDVENEGD